MSIKHLLEFIASAPDTRHENSHTASHWRRFGSRILASLSHTCDNVRLFLSALTNFADSGHKFMRLTQ
jgi:hypothetical protein